MGSRTEIVLVVKAIEVILVMVSDAEVVCKPLAESTLVEDDGNRTSSIGIELLAAVMVDSVTVVLVEVVVESVTLPADTSPLLNSNVLAVET